jgi:hypothetical protein
VVDARPLWLRKGLCYELHAGPGGWSAQFSRVVGFAAVAPAARLGPFGSLDDARAAALAYLLAAPDQPAPPEFGAAPWAGQAPRPAESR